MRSPKESENKSGVYLSSCALMTDKLKSKVTLCPRLTFLGAESFLACTSPFCIPSLRFSWWSVPLTSCSLCSFRRFLSRFASRRASAIRRQRGHLGRKSCKHVHWGDQVFSLCCYTPITMQNLSREHDIIRATRSMYTLGSHVLFEGASYIRQKGICSAGISRHTYRQMTQEAPAERIEPCDAGRRI